MHRVEEALWAGQRVSAQVQADVFTHHSVQITNRSPSALCFIITSKEIRRMLGLSQRLSTYMEVLVCVFLIGVGYAWFLAKCQALRQRECHFSLRNESKPDTEIKVSSPEMHPACDEHSSWLSSGKTLHCQGSEGTLALSQRFP